MSQALADGLYWLAEKLLWGYEDVQRDALQALKLFRQAAALGDSDALVRLGEMHERGLGTEPDLNAAIREYRKATDAGNIVGLARLANLVSRSGDVRRADKLWDRFFDCLDAASRPTFRSASIGELLHSYISLQVHLVREPKHWAALIAKRDAIVGYHQQLLEHADTAERIARLRAVQEWMEANLCASR